MMTLFPWAFCQSAFHTVSTWSPGKAIVICQPFKGEPVWLTMVS